MENTVRQLRALLELLPPEAEIFIHGDRLLISTEEGDCAISIQEHQDGVIPWYTIIDAEGNWTPSMRLFLEQAKR